MRTQLYLLDEILEGLARGIHFFVEKHKHHQSFGLVNSGVGPGGNISKTSI
jgi:hypothetical protein